MARKQTLREVMTTDPVVLDASATLGDAAREMRSRHVGDVLVGRDGKLCGIVTDRDLVVRGLAEDPDGAGRMALSALCTSPLTTLSPDDGIDDAIRLMSNEAVRRIPVVEDGRALGIVALGDLAIARDRDSLLGKISAAPPTD